GAASTSGEASATDGRSVEAKAVVIGDLPGAGDVMPSGSIPARPSPSHARRERRVTGRTALAMTNVTPGVLSRGMSATILIVEDEFAVARGIQYALQHEGYQVAVAKSGEEGLDFAINQAPDLVLLDVRLPGMDGFEVLRRLRAAGSKAPVLVLTARDDEVDKVIGRELGAGDYLAQPRGLRRLMGRISAR